MGEFLFDVEGGELCPQAARLGPKLRSLADSRRIFLGTSSWKYEGWLGTIYLREKYMTRGKFSKAKFEGECLREYAATFPIVGGDFSFYQFPTADYWDRLFASAPASLLFALKVPEDVTVPVWPAHARYGKRAGATNAHFLDARLFENAFLHPLDRHRARVACLIFEFGAMSKLLCPTLESFQAPLDAFFGQLSVGFRYAVEVRNPEFLQPAYFEMLTKRNVAHAFNAWTRMPELPDQVGLPGAFTADFTVVRALLPRGRTYEQAVKALQPYESIKESCASARQGMRDVIDHARRLRVPAFILVNNRLEGHAPSTIEEVIAEEN